MYIHIYIYTTIHLSLLSSTKRKPERGNALDRYFEASIYVECIE